MTKKKTISKKFILTTNGSQFYINDVRDLMLTNSKSMAFVFPSEKMALEVAKRHNLTVLSC